MAITDDIKSVYDLIKGIKDRFDTSKENDKTAKELQERINGLKLILDNLDKRNNKEKYKQQIDVLINCVTQVNKFLEELQSNKSKRIPVISALLELIKANDVKEKFDKLMANLRDCNVLLTVALCSAIGEDTQIIIDKVELLPHLLTLMQGLTSDLTHKVNEVNKASAGNAFNSILVGNALGSRISQNNNMGPDADENPPESKQKGDLPKMGNSGHQKSQETNSATAGVAVKSILVGNATNTEMEQQNNGSHPVPSTPARTHYTPLNDARNERKQVQESPLTAEQGEVNLLKDLLDAINMNFAIDDNQARGFAKLRKSLNDLTLTRDKEGKITFKTDPEKENAIQIISARISALEKDANIKDHGSKNTNDTSKSSVGNSNSASAQQMTKTIAVGKATGSQIKQTNM